MEEWNEERREVKLGKIKDSASQQKPRHMLHKLAVYPPLLNPWRPVRAALRTTLPFHVCPSVHGLSM
ncbi:uncharacterized [Tachysurus ichikawai]